MMISILIYIKHLKHVNSIMISKPFWQRPRSSDTNKVCPSKNCVDVYHRAYPSQPGQSFFQAISVELFLTKCHN
jgi:hypothetical protein